MIFKYKDIEYYIIEAVFPAEISFLIEHGWGNGYVRIADNHEFYGLDCDDIPVWIHGGLTYGSYRSNGVYGFDTAHYGDNIDRWNEDRVLDETRWLAIQFHLRKPIVYNDYVENYHNDMLHNEKIYKREKKLERILKNN